MKPAPKPSNETERLRALEEYRILDSPPEQSYDDLVLLAAHICETPIALLSLVDEHRQWFKARTGLTAESHSREISLCAHAILKPGQLTVVEDASKDDRFQDNPLVADSPHIRFYAATPLVTPSGCAIGTLCVIDRVARGLSDNQRSALLALGRQVMAQMELRRRMAEKDRVEEALRASELEARKLGLVASRTDNAVIITNAAGLVEWVNAGFTRILGYTLDEVRERQPGLLLQGAETSRETALHVRRCIREGRACQVEVLNYAKDGRKCWMATEIQPIRDDKGVLTNFIAVERDVTLQKETEQALLETTTLQEAILNAANYSIISTCPDGVILTFNAAAERMTGYTASEVVGRMHFSELHDPEELTHYARDLSKEMGRVLAPGFEALVTKARMGIPDEREWTCIRKEGQRLPIMLSLTALKDKRGSVNGFLGIANDITERRHAEQRLVDRQRFSALTAAVSVALTHGDQLHDTLQTCVESVAHHLKASQVRIWTVDLPGLTLVLLASAGRMTDQDERFLQVPLGSTLLGRIGLHREACLANRMAEDPQFDEEQGRCPAEVTAFAGWPLVVADRLVGVLAIWLEQPLSSFGRQSLATLTETLALGITRKLTETALLETDDRLRRQNHTLIDLANRLETAYEDLQQVLEAITEAAADTLNVARVSVWIFDRDHTCIQCRDLYEQQLNRHSSGAQLAAADFPAYFQALKQSNAISADDACNDPRTREFAEPYLKPLGITSMLDAPIRSAGRVVGVICHEQVGVARQWTGEEEGFARSLADLVSLAIEMKHHERAESELATARDAALAATRAKSDFLAHMSHEIRTPMNGIIGMTSVLRKTNLTEAQRDMVETINQSGDLLLDIINDILDFSKIEAGKMEFESIEFDLRTVVEQAVEILAERAAAKKLELASFIHPDVPCALKGDPTRLRQVLVNLLSNAIKFTEHGEVVVDVALESKAADRQLTRFTVKDTGIGISQPAQGRLFERFTQGDDATSRLHGGTGLGLAICKRLVGMMHGDIGVASQPGKGSQFWFTAELERQLQGKTSPAPAFPDLRALVVEDNSTQRNILLCQLKEWDIQCREAASGVEALDALRETANSDGAFDVILLDLYMPGIHGLELIHALRAEPGYAGAKCLLMTPLRSGSDQPEGLEADGVLTKPIRATRLLQWLREQFQPGEWPAPGGADVSSAGAAPSEADISSHLKVLIVEDNPVNQRVALLNLNELGLEADIAANGREALEALEVAVYDVIFMDCQMPVMDGYETTRAIRRRDDERAGVRIIAMTASAMEGDRDKCLAAGMDDYVSKPIQLEELQRVLSKAPRRDSPSAMEAVCDSANPVDMEVLRKVSLAKPGQLSELVLMYLRQTRCYMEELEEAAREGAADKVRYMAHKIAGSSASCGVSAMVGLMRELESAGRLGDLERAEDLLDKARTAFGGVQDFFERELQLSPSPRISS